MSDIKSIMLIDFQGWYLNMFWGRSGLLSEMVKWTAEWSDMVGSVTYKSLTSPSDVHLVITKAKSMTINIGRSTCYFKSNDSKRFMNCITSDLFGSSTWKLKSPIISSSPDNMTSLSNMIWKSVRNMSTVNPFLGLGGGDILQLF